MRIQRGMVNVVSIMMVVGAAVSAQAADVFNNFGPGDTFSSGGLLLQGEDVGTIGNVDQAAAFTVGASSYSLTGISIGVGVSPGPTIIGTGPIDIVLASDSGGLPGTALRTFSLVANSTGQQILSATDDGSFTLTAGTTYWVIADARGTFDGGWGKNTIGDIGPTAGRANNNPWTLHAPGDERFAFRVEGTLVPAPSTFAVGGVTLLGLAARKRRRSA